MNTVRLLLRCFDPSRARCPALLDVAAADQGDAGSPSFAALQKLQDDYEKKLTAKQVEVGELERKLKLAEAAILALGFSTSELEEQLDQRLVKQGVTKEERDGYRARCALVEGK